MSTALFGSQARAASKNLVEFKAGKMHLRGKMVHPDKRKGSVYLYQSDDGLMHFCWKDRTSGHVEEDLIIFPDDCEYRRIAACTTGRAYVLKFRSTSRRLFFWMQEAKTDKDEEHCRKINELLNNPPTPGSHSTPSRSAGSSILSSGELANMRDSDLQNIIGNISQQQLMQILGNGVPNLSSLLGPNAGSGSAGSRNTTSVTPTTASTPTTSSTPPPSSSTSSSVTPMDTSTTVAGSGSTAKTSSTAAKSGSTGAIQLSDLQNILSGMMGPDGAKTAAAAGGPGVDLSPAMTAEALKPILTNPEFVEQLRPYLPTTSEPLPPADQLRDTIASPQFKQAVSVFSHALQSGQLGPLVKQFGLGEEAVLAAASADMEAFVKALGKKQASSKESDKKPATEDSSKKTDDDDEKMAVD